MQGGSHHVGKGENTSGQGEKQNAGGGGEGKWIW